MLTAILNVIYREYLRTSLSGVITVRGRLWLTSLPLCSRSSAWAFSWRTLLTRTGRDSPAIRRKASPDQEARPQIHSLNNVCTQPVSVQPWRASL